MHLYEYELHQAASPKKRPRDADGGISASQGRKMYFISSVPDLSEIGVTGAGRRAGGDERYDQT